MPKDYNDKSKKRERSRSRSISQRHHNTELTTRRDRKKTSKWSDAPPENSKFSDTIPDKDQIITGASSSFDSKININSLSNQVTLQQQNVYPLKSKINPLNFLDDNTKLKKKIYIPKSSEINYVGLLIGPKGTYQKRLEQQTGCKILIRGKGTQKEGNPPQPDDHEEKHVLIIGDSEDKLARAQSLIERVLYADEKTRNKIKEEQIKASQEIRSELLMQGGEPISQIEEFMLTPYGPPDKNARIVPVPNDCVGLIIGKNGETIRRLNRESGCKVQIAIKPIPNTEVRNVFIEGPPEKYEIAKKLIEEIVSEQISLKEKNPFFQLNLINSLNTNSGDTSVGQVNPFPGPHTPLRIPNKMVGLIIGRNGETVKNIHEKTRCYIFIPKESRPGEDFRELQLSGPPGSVELCKREIISMIHLALYGRLPYMNSLFYPFLDPVTGLPIIDPNTLSQLDPNTKMQDEVVGAGATGQVPGVQGVSGNTGNTAGEAQQSVGDGEDNENKENNLDNLNNLNSEDMVNDENKQDNLENGDKVDENNLNNQNNGNSENNIENINQIPNQNPNIDQNHPTTEDLNQIQIQNPNPNPNPNKPYPNDQQPNQTTIPKDENPQSTHLPDTTLPNLNEPYLLPHMQQMHPPQMQQDPHLHNMHPQAQAQAQAQGQGQGPTQIHLQPQMQPQMHPQMPPHIPPHMQPHMQHMHPHMQQMPMPGQQPHLDFNQKQSGYDLHDYDNPMNYDLYFQSLYQMYPHMNDYFKQGNQTNMSNPQYIICNNGLMDENRGMYDPNYIVQMFNQMMDNNNTNLQDGERQENVPVPGQGQGKEEEMNNMVDMSNNGNSNVNLDPNGNENASAGV